MLAGKPFRGVNFWPSIPGWRASALSYFNQCLELGRLIHRGLSLDLGLEETFFDQYLTQPIATLRMLRYPPAAESGPLMVPVPIPIMVTLRCWPRMRWPVWRFSTVTEWIQAPSIPGILCATSVTA